MKERNGKTMYAAGKGGAFTGVYTSVQKARAATNDGLTEITPLLLPGSPESEKYVCMAQGEWTVLRSTGGEFEADYVQLGPSWGVNPQSAVADLLGYGFGRRNIRLTKLVLFETDRDYSNQPPQSLIDEVPFYSMMEALAEKKSLEAEQLSKDYIERHFAIQREREEYGRRAGCPQLDLIARYLMKVACERASSKGGVRFCGTYLSRVRERTERMLISRFSVRDMQILALLLKLEDSQELAAEISDGSIPADYIAGLLERARECVPSVRGMCGRKLADYLD